MAATRMLEATQCFVLIIKPFNSIGI